METILENAKFWQETSFVLLLLLLFVLVVSLLNKGEGILYYQRYRLLTAVLDNDFNWFKKIILESPRGIFDDYSIKTVAIDFIKKQINKKNEADFIKFFLADPEKNEVFFMAFEQLGEFFWADVYCSDILEGEKRFDALNNFFDCLNADLRLKIWQEVLKELEEASISYYLLNPVCSLADISFEKDRIKALLKN